MKTIWNRTARPLRIPLHGGRLLHLGPKNSGQVTDDDVGRVSLRRLIASGEVLVLEEESAEVGCSLPGVERGGFRPGYSRRDVFIPRGGRTGGSKRED